MRFLLLLRVTVGVAVGVDVDVRVDPLIETPNGVPFQGKFDMGVARVDAGATGVTHESFAHFLQDPHLEQSGVERVPEIMKPDMPDAGPSQCGLPRGFDRANGPLVIGEDQQAVVRAPF